MIFILKPNKFRIWGIFQLKESQKILENTLVLNGLAVSKEAVNVSDSMGLKSLTVLKLGLLFMRFAFISQLERIIRDIIGWNWSLTALNLFSLRRSLYCSVINIC